MHDKVIRSTSPEEVFLTAAELAKRWRVTVSALATMRSKGRPPAFMRCGGGPRGGKVIYPMTTILQHEAEQIAVGTQLRGPASPEEVFGGPRGGKVIYPMTTILQHEAEQIAVGTQLRGPDAAPDAALPQGGSRDGS